MKRTSILVASLMCSVMLFAQTREAAVLFISEKAFSNVTMLERCYLSEDEKNAYLNARQESFSMNQDKVKLARKQYRNQGEYIEDILQ